MSETNHFSERLREPLNETTRKVRRNLMAASVVGIVLTKVGLVPTKISAFGVEFSSSNQQALMLLLASAICYFMVSFIVYVYSELTAWQLVFTSKEMEDIKAEATRSERQFLAGNDHETKFREHVRHLYFRTKPTFYIRIFVELAIPIVFAFYSAYALFAMDVSQPAKPTVMEQAPVNKQKQVDVK
ncbi:hypothetical protein [Salinivibrio sp. HTSP]|uniref:hypothetical protein n=1 Tax=Salinivibrio sp. HTSP TaxID=2115977 RepID=UPI0012D721FA|nr:hypothetical protein [Salinivibrio sp. HTSP]